MVLEHFSFSMYQVNYLYQVKTNSLIFFID